MNWIKKKKEKPSPVLTVEEVLREGLGQNLTVLAGERVILVVSRMPLSLFEEALKKEDRGLLLNTFSEGETYPFFYFFPGSFCRHFEPLHRRVHSLEEGMESRVLFLKRMEGYTSRLFYISGNEVVPFFSLPGEFRRDEAEALLWRSSGCVVYRITAGEFSFYALAREEVVENLKRRFQEEAEFSVLVREEVLLHYTGSQTEAFDRDEKINLTITKPEEFLLGRFFLPPVLKLGKQEILGRIKGIRAAREFPEKGLCFKVTLLSAGLTGEVYYLFPLPPDARDEAYSVFFTKLLQGILSRTMRMFKAYIPVEKFNGKQVEFRSREDLITLDGEIELNRRVVSCRILPSSGFMEILTRAFLLPWEVEYLKRNLFTAVLALLSLNRRLLGTDLSRVFRAPGKESSSFMLLYQFLNLVEEQDARLVVQNYMLPRGWGGRKMQGLFYFLDQAGELHGFRSFNAGEFKNRLPRVPREDWERSAGASSSLEELKEENYRLMKALYRECTAERLLLSFKARFILKEEFFETVKLFFQDKIEARKRDYPALLRLIPPARVQGLLISIPLKELALAFAHNPGNLRFFHPYLSRRYKEDLEITLKDLEARLIRGLVDYEEIYQSMVKLDSELEALARTHRLEETGQIKKP